MHPVRKMKQKKEPALGSDKRFPCDELVIDEVVRTCWDKLSTQRRDCYRLCTSLAISENCRKRKERGHVAGTDCEIATSKRTTITQNHCVCKWSSMACSRCTSEYPLSTASQRKFAEIGLCALSVR